MDKLAVMLLFGMASEGQIQPCPPVCSLLHPCAPRLVSWLILPEVLDQVSLPKVQGQDDIVAIPGPLCTSILPCAVVFFLAHMAKSQLLHLPLSRSMSAGFPGRAHRNKNSHQSQPEQISDPQLCFFPCLGSTWLQKP